MQTFLEFATKKMPMHSTFTEMNHLGASLAARPEKLSAVVTELFATKLYSGNSLMNMLVKNKQTRTTNSTSWEYDVVAGMYRPATAIKTTYTAGDKIGWGRTPIELYLDTDQYIHGDVIHPGSTDKRYQARVIDNPVKIGSLFKYRVRMMSDVMDFTLPYKYVAPGAIWGKLFSQYEEGSDQSGSTVYNQPTSLTGSMSRYRKMYHVTGDAANEVLAVAIRGRLEDGQEVKAGTWLKYNEVFYWNQWYREIERGMWYSRKTTTVLGSTNRPILSGAGIQQQLESGVRHFYNSLTGELLQEFIMDMRFGRMTPDQKNTVVGFAGEYGMLAFHEAVTKTASKQPVFTLLTDKFINSASSPYHDNALSYGARFTEWLLPSGVRLKLIHNPVYDDPEINFELDPLTGKPAESMRITFFDVSGEGETSNLLYVDKRNGYKNWYVAGGQNPYGPVTNGLGSHSGDYYEMHVLKQCGVHLEDPTKCGELILQRR